MKKNQEVYFLPPWFLTEPDPLFGLVNGASLFYQRRLGIQGDYLAKKLLVAGYGLLVKASKDRRGFTRKQDSTGHLQKGGKDPW
jgi:hypothetical protein